MLAAEAKKEEKEMTLLTYARSDIAFAAITPLFCIFLLFRHFRATLSRHFISADFFLTLPDDFRCFHFSSPPLLISFRFRFRHYYAIAITPLIDIFRHDRCR